MLHGAYDYENGNFITILINSVRGQDTRYSIRTSHQVETQEKATDAAAQHKRRP